MPPSKTHALLTAYFTQLIASSPPDKDPKIGERQAASLLYRALTDGVIEQPPGWNRRRLKQSGKRTCYRRYLVWRASAGKHLSNHLDLSNFLVYRYQDTFSRICVQDGSARWNLVGQKDDPILLVLKDGETPLFPGEEDKIKRLVPPDLKFGQIHYLSGVLMNGTLTNVKSTGGGKESINSYFHTYHLHPENMFPPMIDKKSLTKIWGSQKIISLIKWVVPGEDDGLETKIERAWKVVRDSVTPRGWLLRELARIYFCATCPDYHTSSCYYNDQKMIEMFFQNQQVFGVDLPPTLKFDLEMELEESQKFAESLLSEMIDKLIPKPRRLGTLDYLDTSLFSIPSVLVKEWKKSPKRPTSLFVKKWLEAGYDPSKVGQYFASPPSGADELLKLPGIKEKVLLIPQRGSEWLEFYSRHFEPENNSHRYVSDDMTPEEILAARYNLIRGNVAETWVLDYVEHYETSEGCLAQVGMVKSEDLFYSPDGLLVNGQEIVPIEVKTIMGSPGLSASFLRDYDLARLQLRGVAKILNLGLHQPLTTRGLGYFLFIFQQNDGWRHDLYKVEYDLTG